VQRRSILGNSPSANGTFAVQLSGGQERLLLPQSADFNDNQFDFSPDGKWVYFSRAQVGNPATAMRVPFAGGQPETVRLPAIENQVARIANISFFGRNTGMRAAVVEKSTNLPRAYLLKPDGTRPVLLPQSVPSAAISHDGRRAIAA
jgi:hypothetical protein